MYQYYGSQITPKTRSLKILFTVFCTHREENNTLVRFCPNPQSQHHFLRNDRVPNDFGRYGPIKSDQITKLGKKYSFIFQSYFLQFKSKKCHIFALCASTEPFPKNIHKGIFKKTSLNYNNHPPPIFFSTWTSKRRHDGNTRYKHSQYEENKFLSVLQANIGPLPVWCKLL